MPFTFNFDTTVMKEPKGAIKPILWVCLCWGQWWGDGCWRKPVVAAPRGRATAHPLPRRRTIPVP